MLFCVPSIGKLHFATERDFTNLHTNPHPIMQLCTKADRGPDLRPALDTCEPVSTVGTLAGKSCLPHLLMVPSTGKKGRQWGCASQKPFAVGFGLEGAETSLLVTGSFSRVRAGWSVVGSGQCPALVRSQYREPFGAVTGAGLSETTSCPM